MKVGLIQVELAAQTRRPIIKVNLCSSASGLWDCRGPLDMLEWSSLAGILKIPASICTNDLSLLDPLLLLETWPVSETQLLLEDIW